jgi:hypothetical protein
MTKSITRAMLTGTMGFAWDAIRIGERIVWWTEGFGGEHAGVIERAALMAGRACVCLGELGELWVNRYAMKRGYFDGEVSGLVALGG